MNVVGFGKAKSSFAVQITELIKRAREADKEFGANNH